MEKAALYAFSHGVEKLPPDAFEKIPFVGPRYFREKEREKQQEEQQQKSRSGSRNKSSKKMSDHRHRSRSRGSLSDDSAEELYEQSRRDQRERRRVRRDQRRSQNGDHDRGYDSDRGTSRNDPYFPPPPRIAVDEHRDLESQAPGGEQYLSRPYNPAEYGANPGTRDTYYSGHPQERLPYNPPPPPMGDGLAPATTQRSRSAQPHFDTSRHSSAAERYRPDDYDPRDDYRRQDSYASQHGDDRRSQYDDDRRSPSPGYPHELALRHPSQRDYHDYDSDDYDDNDRGRGHRQERSRSRAGSIRDKSLASLNRIKDETMKHKKDIGAGALGAVAGGIIGNFVANATNKDKHGHGRNSSKQNLVGAAIGAAIGGIGAAAFEHSREKKRRDKMELEPYSHNNY